MSSYYCAEWDESAYPLLTNLEASGFSRHARLPLAWRSGSFTLTALDDLQKLAHTAQLRLGRTLYGPDHLQQGRVF